MNSPFFLSPSLVIREACVIDGTGDARYLADVVISGSVISAIVAPGTGSAPEVIDGQGLVVCPGFIDSHSHDDQLVLSSREPHPKLSQGVCTVVTGNCGISLAPLVTGDPPAPLDLLGKGCYKYESFLQYLNDLDQVNPCVNVVPLVGHITLRVKNVCDLSREATRAEIHAMRQEVITALDAGAFGMSTGVYYPPARAATTAELVEVCAGLRGRNAILAMHIRDEGDDIDSALREALDVGASSQARLVLSHHKAVGPQNWGRTVQTLQTIDEAARTQAVCMDCYPYEASSTMLDPVKAARIGEVMITWSKPHPDQNGKRLKEIAQQWGLDLQEAARRLMPGGAIYFAMTTEDVDRVLQHPLSMIGSDGLPHDSRPHPRLWGTFPRVLGHYSRDRKLLSLEMAVHKMTGLTAQRFGLNGRGTVAVGNAADLVIFDPNVIADNATYEEPQKPPSGIEAVIVNGQIAIRRGQHLHIHAGRRLTP